MKAVFEEIEAHGLQGMTDQEIQIALDMDGNSERPARVSLCDIGLVRDSGFTRANRSGRQAIVWVKEKDK